MDAVKLTIEPGSPLRGAISAQPSKSMAHRTLIGAALAKGESKISPLHLSDDIRATLSALISMGLCSARQSGDTFFIEGGGAMHECECDCALSGSTLRMLLPLALAHTARVFFTGRPALLARPMTPYFEMFPGMLTRTERGITVHGALRSGEYELPGGVSSQFISGLLFALPLAQGDSRISLMGAVESRSYIDMTLDALRRFGVNARWDGDHTLLIDGSARYQCGEFLVPGDWSHAAFFLAAGALGGGIRILGLDRHDLHPDRAAVEILRSLGADIRWEGGALICEGGELRPGVIDVSQCPDLAPALAVTACGISGKTRITGAARLRFKESNRLEGLAGELKSIGADIACGDDFMEINGTGRLSGGHADALGDHRIAMALCIAASICEGEVRLSGFEHVAKSAPRFFDEFTMLGGGIAREQRI